jgi:nitrogen fixation NifU-like protein
VSGADTDTLRLYQDVILRHSRAPLHAQRPDRIDGSGIGDNPLCGDHVEVFVARNADGTLAQIGFEARGCAISVASADLMAELLHGAAPDQIARIENAFRRMIETGPDADDGAPELETLRPLSGVHDYPSRRRCATLPWQALLQAIASAPPNPEAP